MNPLAFIQAFFATYHKHIKAGEYFPINGEYPMLYTGYAEAAKERDLIAIHSTSSDFPKIQFERLLKNMDDNGMDWLEDNYQPITHTVYNDFINTIQRATHSIVVEDSGVDEKVTEYLYEDLPEYKNINAYNKSISPALIIQDAMAVFAVCPEYVYTEQIDEENSRIVGDINPTVNYYECWRVLAFKAEEYCLIMRPDKSYVTFGNTTRKTGFIFDYYDKDVIMRITQVGKEVDYNFEVTLVFPHGLDYMPVVRAGGIASVKDNNVVYTSHFYGAVPHLNLALHDAIYLSSVKRKCAFPTPVMVSDECHYHDNGRVCDNGRLNWFEDGEEKAMTCPSCNGTGKGQSLNPFSTMFAPVTSRENDTKYSASDVLNYVSPDPAIMEFLRKETDLQLTKAAAELKISRSMGQEGGNVTATERGIDLKATYAFIKSFADVLVQRWNWQMYTIAAMKWGQSDDLKVPHVLMPTQFDLKSTEDYLDELKLAKDAGVSGSVLTKLTSDYLYNVYEGSYISERIVQTIVLADRLLGVTAQDIATKRDTIQNWEIILHDSAFTFIENLIATNSDFIDLEVNDRVVMLQNMAKAIVPPTNTAAVEDVLF